MTENKQEMNPPKLLNKQKIRLLFPYSENQEVKKLGARWDTENKMWYYPSIDGDLPFELQKYKCHFVEIEYNDKEYYKPILTSMKFDKIRKMWMVNDDDFQKFVKLN